MVAHTSLGMWRQLLSESRSVNALSRHRRPTPAWPIRPLLVLRPELFYPHRCVGVEDAQQGITITTIPRGGIAARERFEVRVTRRGTNVDCDVTSPCGCRGP